MTDQIGDAYVDREAPKRLAATGVKKGSRIRIIRGKHTGKTYTVETLKPSEAEVYAGGRWWSAWYESGPWFEVVR